MKTHAQLAAAGLLVSLTLAPAWKSEGQQGPPPPRGGGGPPPMRQHRATEAEPLKLVPATKKPPGKNERQIAVAGDRRTVIANALPDHLVGAFPNRGNPH